MPKFKVTLSSLHNVLSYTRSYEIPTYQRPYTWKVGRVEELWDDIVEMYEDQGRMGEEYLLGSIVTVESTNNNELVDGQQRLVSLTLMFCAMRDSLQRHLDQCDKKLQADIKNLIKQLEKHILSEQKPLIVLNNNDDQVLFEAICRAEDTGDHKKNASRAFLQNYNKFYLRTEDLYKDININDLNLSGTKKLGGIIDAITNRVFLVDIVADNEYEAGQIFQALNSKNQTLTQSDLIKNYLIQQVSGGTDVGWSTVFTPFEKEIKGKPEKADSYVYDSMMSRYCQLHSKDVGKKYLYKAVKEKEVRGDEKCAKKFVAKLKTDIKIIHELENPASKNTDIVHLLYGLKQLNARYFRRSIIAAVRLWGWEDPRTHNIIDLLVKFFFMYKTVLKMDVDKIRNIARNLTKAIVEKPKTVKITDLYEIVLEPIYKNSANDRKDLEEFHERFQKEFVVQQYRDNAIKYLFISIERELQKEFSVVPEGYDVEHIFPQSPYETSWPNHSELKPYKNNIGNLTLLPRKWNVKLQNYSFQTKKQGVKNNGKEIRVRGKLGKDSSEKFIVVSYENSKLELNRHLQNCDRWDQKKVLERQGILQQYAESVWDLREYDNQVRNVNGDKQS